MVSSSYWDTSFWWSLLIGVVRRDKGIVFLFLRTVFIFYRNFASTRLTSYEDYFFRILIMFFDVMVMLFKGHIIIKLSLEIPAIAKLARRCGFHVTIPTPMPPVFHIPLHLKGENAVAAAAVA